MGGPIDYDFGGLVTAPGLLARNPASCVDVKNFRFPQPGLMRKRPGFDLQANTAGTNEIFTAILASSGLGGNFFAVGTGNSGRAIYYGGVSSFTTLTDPDSSMRTVSTRDPRLFAIGRAYYMLANYGVRRVASTFSTHQQAGMPRGMGPTTYSMDAAVYSVLTGTGGFLADGSSVAYRVTWHLKNGTQVLGGAPTGRVTIRNISGTSGYSAATDRNVVLRIPLPYALDSQTVKAGTSYFWRLWRTYTFSDSPDDDMRQVAEAYVTSTDVSNGYASFTDETPDAFLFAQAPLHTNSLDYPEAGATNGQSFASSPPPFVCRDVCEWSDCAWYAAPVRRPQLELNLISASFSAGNTITVGSTTLTAVAGAPSAAGEFTIVTGLSTLSLNIEATARNIVDAYNRTSGLSKVAAYHVATGTDAPGRILFEANSANSISVSSASAGTLFSPDITTAQTDTGGTTTNGLLFSKPLRADAVPPCNSLSVGPSDCTIFRIQPFRNRLLVFTDRGLYQVTGTYFGNFTVSLLDSSLHILEINAVAVCGDACYAWCYEGIAEITDGGSQIISLPIEGTVKKIAYDCVLSSASATFDTSAFAVADTTNHLVCFFYNTSIVAGTQSSKWLEFDVRERKWTRGQFDNGLIVSCGALLSTSRRIALALSSSNFNSPTGAAKWFLARDPYALSSPFSDDNSSGTATAVQSSATFQFKVLDPDARFHWQQTLFEFEEAWLGSGNGPTGVAVSWETDTSTESGVSYALTDLLLRAEPPLSVRRATRQRVTLAHATDETCGLVVVNQSIAQDKSRFPG